MSSYMPLSKSDTHITPDRVFDIIFEHWHIAKNEFFDPCPVNGENGLLVSWQPMNFVNPPYSLLKEFVYKAIEESKRGNITILLLPTKTDQKWFHDLLKENIQIKWIEKRLKFKNNKWAATQPHFLVLLT